MDAAEGRAELPAFRARYRFGRSGAERFGEILQNSRQWKANWRHLPCWTSRPSGEGSSSHFKEFGAVLRIR